MSELTWIQLIGGPLDGQLKQAIPADVLHFHHLVDLDLKPYAPLDEVPDMLVKIVSYQRTRRRHPNGRQWYEWHYVGDSK